MSRNWAEQRLGDLLELVIDHRGKTPKKLGGDFVDDGVPVVSAIHVKGGVIDWSQRERYVTQEMFVKWMPIRLERGDVLLTSEAPLGETALVPTSEDLVLSQRLFALRGKPGLLDSAFLRYFLASVPGQQRLNERASGTTVVGIRQEELLKVLVPLPPIVEQRRIAGVLGALDDLIDTNKTLIGRLVEQADTVAEGRRRIVKGEEVTFGAVANISGGGTPSTKRSEYWGGGISWATPTDMTALPSPYLFSTSRQITQAGLEGCSSSLFPTGAILMTSRATIGATAITQMATAVNQGFIVLEPRLEVDRWYLFHEMRRRVPEFIARANGSTFLEISRGVFKALEIVWPSEEDRHSLARAVEPLHAAAAALQVEVAELRRTRDELLPLLLSGRVAVGEAAA
jgi:type I restriction enzyme S subunit